MPFTAPNSSTPDALGRIKTWLEDEGYDENGDLVVNDDIEVQVLDTSGEVMKVARGSLTDLPDSVVDGATGWTDLLERARTELASQMNLTA